MAVRNIDEVSPRKVRKSFVVTVDVNEAASADDLVFISPNQDKNAITNQMMQNPGAVFFHGQEDLAARWMAMGSGALPLNLFTSSDVSVVEAPIANVREARRLLDQLYDNGDLDCLPTDEAYASLREVFQLLKQTETSLSGS